MSGGSDDLSLARLRRENDNTKVSPAELLRLVANEIERGLINPNRMMVITIEPRPDNQSRIDTYRCGVTRAEEIGYLELARHKRMADWCDTD